jgi:hypothetical protein
MHTVLHLFTDFVNVFSLVIFMVPIIFEVAVNIFCDCTIKIFFFCSLILIMNLYVLYVCFYIV